MATKARSCYRGGTVGSRVFLFPGEPCRWGHHSPTGLLRVCLSHGLNQSLSRPTLPGDVRVLLRCLLEYGGERPAWPTPRSPEVDEHDALAADRLREVCMTRVLSLPRSVAPFRASAAEDAGEKPASLDAAASICAWGVFAAAPLRCRHVRLHHGDVLTAPRPCCLAAGAASRRSAHDVSSLTRLIPQGVFRR